MSANEGDVERQIRAYAQRVADMHTAALAADARNGRIRLQVAGIILRAGGDLPLTSAEFNILSRIYPQLQWKKDGHK